MPTESPAPQNPKKLVAGQVAGGIAGIAAGTYSGVNLLIPGVAAMGIWLLGSKVSPPAVPRYLTAITAQGAQLAWLFFGMAVLGVWGANVIDLVVLGVGLVWLWVRPGIWPVAVLTAFQLFALSINLYAIFAQPVGSAEHRSLIVHIGLRVIGVAAMWHAFIATRRPRGEA